MNNLKLQIYNKDTDDYYDYLTYTHNDYLLYLNNSLKINNNIAHFRGCYRGSSSRINELGTFYFGNTNEYRPLQLRILENDNILYEFELNNNHINAFLNSNNRINNYLKPPSCRLLIVINENITIYARHLYKFQNYPYEVAGVAFKKP